MIKIINQQMKIVIIKMIMYNRFWNIFKNYSILIGRFNFEILVLKIKNK